MTLSPKQRLAQAFQDKRALIVDDIATSRETLSAMIAQFGVTAQTASSGPEALAILHDAAARGKAFDVVLMDWRMPGMDGVETARHIRSDKFLRDTPAVLMVTAHAGEEIIRNVDTLELQGLLIKPVTESVLFNAIQPIFDPPAQGGSGERDPREPSAPSRHPARQPCTGCGRQPLQPRGRDRLPRTRGVHVTTAESGFEALDQLEAKRFDAVLMDMQMPEMDGLETTKRIREIQSLRDLPVIALTAQARVEDREATLLVGMAAHLTKPIDESLLYSTLASVLDGQMTPMQLAAPEPEPEIATLRSIWQKRSNGCVATVSGSTGCLTSSCATLPNAPTSYAMPWKRKMPRRLVLSPTASAASLAISAPTRCSNMPKRWSWRSTTARRKI
ncbi:response regulator [Paracoccus cavernae]|uniref:Response regulator n=1 Tax=Paracoccus cavernae TaxID=1571207 RepID=A0ABT8D3Q1_9RHOB|nr:response regulator [Paracoccus cavernae]